MDLKIIISNTIPAGEILFGQLNRISLSLISCSIASFFFKWHQLRSAVHYKTTTHRNDVCLLRREMTLNTPLAVIWSITQDPQSDFQLREKPKNTTNACLHATRYGFLKDATFQPDQAQERQLSKAKMWKKFCSKISATLVIYGTS